MSKINIFICYSHKDTAVLGRLCTFVNTKSIPTINVWTDNRIEAGQEWHKVILERLDQADIILLLLSQDFLMSEYITDVELKTALDRYMAGKSRVIPIFARNCELRRYPGITALQGLPKNMAFFHGADEEDKLLTSIQQEIDTIAGELSLNRKLASSVDDADEKGKMAREIIQLRENRKIFLCLSVSDEGKKRRRELMYHVEGKVRHEKWPFEVVPGINSQQDPNDPDVQTQMKDSVYSIHIVSHPNELVEGPGRLQYDLACQRAKQQSFYRIIIWYPDASIRTSMEPSFVGELATHPNFMGYDYEDLFALLDSLEEERQRQLTAAINKFSDTRKVIMLYNFNTDHESDPRIKIKERIENMDMVALRISEPFDSPESEKAELDGCHGALIYYGHADPKWYLVRQSLLLKAQNIKSRAVFVDEPNPDKKISRDILNKQLIVIKDVTEIIPKLDNFLNNL